VAPSLALLLALLAACSGKPGHAVGPDVAYVGVDNTGLVVIEGGKARTLIENKYGIRDLAVGPNGELFATAIGGMWETSGGALTKLPDPAPNRQFEKIAVAPDGTLWGIDQTGAGKWNGREWTLVPRSTFAGDELLSDIAVDSGGHAWVTTMDHIWRLDGDTWSKVDTFISADEPFFHSLATDSAGDVYVASAEGVFLFDQKTWTKISMVDDDFPMLGAIVAGPDGRIAVSGGGTQFALRAPGKSWRILSLADRKVNASEGEVEAIDGSGRTWLETDNGVAILDADGALVQQWLPGTLPGVTGRIQTIAVSGKGPVMPQLTAVAKGTITGTFIFEGQAVAGAPVELCASPATMLTGKTPCSESPAVYEARTGDDGRFTVANVPISSYGFAVRTKGTWFVTWGIDACCSEMKDSGSYDVGSIEVGKDP
jgi:ligand-binding sensor domain-containing protein